MSTSILDLPPRWLLRPTFPEGEARLVKELGIPPLLARLVSQRGYEEPAAAEKFLHPRLEDLFDPHLLPDYDKARDAIFAARDRKDLIFVHGDYDVDGVTSAALFDRFLSTIGCNVHTHVPHRMKEGYGIHASAVDAAIDLGAKLFLTCDCGSSALEQIKKAREAGMVVVVTDHHELGEEWPQAHAFMNPHRPDSTYPFASLSGVGVAYKFAMGLALDLGMPVDKFHAAFLDLVVLGTVADVMPLINENRILTRHGLARLPQSKRRGIQALMDVSEIARVPGKSLRTYDIGFRLGPRINATGRIDDASRALALLLAKEDQEAKQLATELDSINKERREEQARMIEQAAQAVIDEDLERHYVLMVGHESWHAGIVGIVAGKLVEMYRRPAFVLFKDEKNGIYKGSARSIEAFHLKDAIDHLGDVLKGGGHARAAGCSFPVERLDEVRERMHAYAAGFLEPDDFVPQVGIDIEAEPAEVNLRAVESLELLEPCGEANPGPTMVVRGVTLGDVKTMGKENDHIRMNLCRPGQPPIKAVYWRGAAEIEALDPLATYDVVFRAGLNEYRDTVSVQCSVTGLRPSGPIELG